MIDVDLILWTPAATPSDSLLFMLNDTAWICAGSAKQHELLKVSLDRHVLEHDLLHVSSSVGTGLQLLEAQPFVELCGQSGCAKQL